MRSVLTSLLVSAGALLSVAAPAFGLPAVGETAVGRRWATDGPIAPRVMLITMEYKICMMTTGEAEINAGVSVTALWLSPKFDLKLTYWFVTGIAGVNPYWGTLGSAMFARFAIQVALQYELDARQMPSNWTTGYWAYGTPGPGIAPAKADYYGTEVFELNTNLLARALDLVKNVKLNDSADAITYRANFDYAPANEPPTIVQCDVATSDVYYAGTLLSESFGNMTKLLTNGTANYCSTAQEDNATLESIMRGTVAGLCDYSRVIVLRTGSDFDRAPPPAANLTAYEAFEANQGGFGPALENIYLAGWPIVKEIAYDWDAWVDGTPTQSKTAPSFYGDALGTLLD
ncbi:purine nucleoside permease [Pseudohyphozyma bogoriensis]|nr:purine nucleoside permease [Pseudohyphozyma bogoriensis]